MSEKTASCYVGIDVSKKKLDLCILPQRIFLQEPNTGDFKELLDKLKPYSPTLVVAESSGGYDKSVLKALFQAGIPVSQEHALRIHHHAQSRGKRSKTDPIDAETIAHYAQCYADQIQPMACWDEKQERLQQLVKRRLDLVGLCVREKNRLKAPSLCSEVQKSCSTVLEALQKELKQIEEQIAQWIQKDEILQKKKELILSVPGMGKVCAHVLLTHLPELGKKSNKTIASLVGVAPFARQSGQYRGERHIAGGRSEVRSVLFIAMMCGVRFNPVLQKFYQHLIQKGKKPKVAKIACIRKLLCILNAMLTKQESFQST